jgi:hypothetical protein
MKDQSIRKLTKEECRKLADVMGFEKGAVDSYEGRYVKIKLISPKRIDSWDGVFVYVNTNDGREKK